MSKTTLSLPALCLITDPSLPDLMSRVAQALQAGVTMVQLRGHELSASTLYRLACELRVLCQAHEATFIINDRIDVGLACRADGIQLGSHSLPISIAQQIVGADYLLGASVHSLAEARAAYTQGADFLLVGTIFASASHPGEPPAGTNILHAIKQEIPDCPVLAIGGITATNARQVHASGADGVAVISAILHATNIQQAVRDIREALHLDTACPNRKGTRMMNEATDTNSTMIQANGQTRTLPTGSTITDLLQTLNVSPQYVVTQLNGTIIPRDSLDQTTLHEGDKLEIITMVGGG